MRSAIIVLMSVFMCGCATFIEKVSDCPPGQCKESMEMVIEDIVHGPFAYAR